MAHAITILWGSIPEPGQKPKTYSFATKPELDAFVHGINEMDGWGDYRQVDEDYVEPSELEG